MPDRGTLTEHNLRLLDVPAESKAPAERPLTERQQVVFDDVRRAGSVGVTAAQVGLHLHVWQGKHGLDGCDWCSRDGLGVLRSKAVAPLVTYRRTPEGNRYLARDPKDRITAPAATVPEPTEAELEANPFAGL